MIAGVLIGLAIASVAYLAAGWWRRRPRRSRIGEECGLCGKELTGRRIHLLVSHPKDAAEVELAGVGGTFVSMAFCSRHCPGGCGNRRCRAKLAVSESD